MAVAARPQVAGSSTGLKAALVVFVVLTVACLAFAIILYTKQEELNELASATSKSADAANQKEQETRNLLTGTFRLLGIDIDPTAGLTQIEGAFQAAVTGIVGTDPARMSDQQKLVAEQARLNPDDAVLTTFQKLHQFAVTRTEEFQTLQAQHKALTEELASKTAALKATEDQYTQNAEKLQGQFVDAEQKNQANRDAWNQDLDALRRQAETEGERASEQLTAERRQRETLVAELAQQKTRIDELIATLAAFRPSADEMSLLQIKDGSIVQTVSGQPIVYISLGRRHHIQPSMTFAVYSRVRGIPADGKGKATVRVTNVFETTSECEVTTADETDPIVEGDVIANPVYDPNRKYNFVVGGDFDLDFDGSIDDPAGEQVKKLIKEWGGNVVDKVDTRTDFVVLGSEPPLPLRLEGDAAAAPAGQLAAQRQTARKAFDEAQQEAKALSIPVLTRTQFLHFIGFGVPRNYKDTQAPM